MKGFLTLFFSFSCLLFSTEKTFIRDYTYETNVLDTKESARIISLTELKTILLEEVGVYIQSELNINTKEILKDGNYEITESVDQTLNSITAGVTKVKILDEKWDKRLIKATYWLKAKITLDPDEIQTNIDSLVKKEKLLKALEISNKKAASALAELKLIRKQLEDSEKEKEELRSKYEKETKILLVHEELEKIVLEGGPSVRDIKSLKPYKNLVNKFSDFSGVYSIVARRILLYTATEIGQVFSTTSEEQEVLRFTLELFQKASEYSDIDYSGGFALIHYLLKEYDISIKYYKEAIKKYPNSPIYKIELSKVYNVIGDYQASIDTKLDVIRNNAGHYSYIGFGHIYNDIAKIYLNDLNNKVEAQKYFDKIQIQFNKESINPCEDEKYINISKKRADQWTEVEYQYFLKKHADCTEIKNYANTYKTLAEYFLQKGFLDSSIYYFEKYFDIDPEWDIRYHADEISELAIKQKKYDVAIDVLREAIQINLKSENKVSMWSMMGYTEKVGDIYNYYIDDNKEAIRWYNVVLKVTGDHRLKGNFPLAPYEYSTNISLGKSYYDNKDFDKAINCFERVIELKNEAKNEVILINERHNRILTKPIYHNRINFSSTYCHLADLYMRAGWSFINSADYDSALIYLDKSLSLEDFKERLLFDYEDSTYDCWADFAYTYYLLGHAQYLIKNDSEAIKNLEYSITMDSEVSAPYEILGMIYHKKNDYIKTVLNLKKAIDLEPNCIDCYYYLGIEYIKKQNMPGAVENIEKAVDLGHNSLWAFKSLASHYYKYQDFEKSEKYYREAYKLEKDFESCNQLGVIYSKQNKNFDAIEFFEEANKLKPDNPRILSILGKLHYKIAIAYHNNDAWPKALTFYRKAAKLDHKKTQEFLKKNGYDW